MTCATVTRALDFEQASEKWPTSIFILFLFVQEDRFLSVILQKEGCVSSEEDN